MGKDFNEYLDEFEANESEEQQVHNESSRPKNFLKKGTRQFLSSARSKMKPERKEEDYEERSRIEPINKSKKAETAKGVAKAGKDKSSLNAEARGLKIETEDDELMFRNQA